MNTDSDIAQACKATMPEAIDWDISLLVPETSPEAIRCDQRAAIWGYLDQYGTATLAVISREVCLPLSIVFWRLVEMGYRFPQREFIHAKTKGCGEWSVDRRAS